MGMAMNQGGANAQNFYAMGQQQAATAPAAPANSWKCDCGAASTGNFCANCGAKKPADTSWKCACGSVNSGNFCANCGAKKPAGGVKCANCGWTSDDTAPKFCPECGNKLGGGNN